MEAIYPLTALSKDLKSVKAEADRGIVHITENGRGAYIFTSERELDELIKRERADAAYEAYVTAAVAQGVSDLKSGRYATSREEMFAQAKERRANA
ncbi:sodium:proline symporter [Curtanaerobium respiraculi]|uniref:sodium:proline symporter n=1 Tax=Curtanaerobium respiraculi TaxID=2949669 RepID=UPI0024B33182|nr:sodium:proline symporter [Curtanaerobium respiraculi]